MKKAPLSVRIIHFFTVIVFWLLMVITIAFFIGNVVLQTNMISEEFQLRIDLPVLFDVEETGTTTLYGKINNVRIEEASGKLHIVDTPPQFSKTIIGVVFVVALLGLFMVWKFKLFITNIKEGVIFDLVNIRNLKHIAYGILALWLVMQVYNWLLYYLLVKHIEFSSIHFHNGVKDTSDLLVVALLLWVLAHVFMKGVELKQEQDLTI